MQYWWVNHKQTAKVEIAEGYVWSPMTNNNGAKNQTYQNLRLAKQYDVVFSYANGAISAVGVVEREATESDRPINFGKAGDQWSQRGWLVLVKWQRLNTPFFPKQHLSSIAPLLPQKYSPIQLNGNGNQGVYLASISNDLGNILYSEISNENPILETVLDEISVSIKESKELEKIHKAGIPETVKQQLVQARIGQGLFRARVEEIERRCRLTYVSDKRFLVASHIKPWRVSDNSERLDGNNGLLLSPHVDKLFDKGYISFSPDGKVLNAHKSIEKIMLEWNLVPTKKASKFNLQQQNYLQYHRDYIYGKKKAELNQ